MTTAALANTATLTHRSLASIDLVIIGIYFLIIFSIGLYFALKERTTTDYFLASRRSRVRDRTPMERHSRRSQLRLRP